MTLDDYQAIFNQVGQASWILRRARRQADTLERSLVVEKAFEMARLALHHLVYVLEHGAERHVGRDTVLAVLGAVSDNLDQLESQFDADDHTPYRPIAGRQGA